MEVFYFNHQKPPWEVILDPDVEAWILALDDATFDRAKSAIDELSRSGPSLGRPRVDRISGSRFANMKELRFGSYRILFAFDPARDAVLLLAGDKRGEWNDWYPKAIPIADQRFADWLHAREEERP